MDCMACLAAPQVRSPGVWTDSSLLLLLYSVSWVEEESRGVEFSRVCAQPSSPTRISPLDLAVVASLDSLHPWQLHLPYSLISWSRLRNPFPLSEGRCTRSVEPMSPSQWALPASRHASSFSSSSLGSTPGAGLPFSPLHLVSNSPTSPTTPVSQAQVAEPWTIIWLFACLPGSRAHSAPGGKGLGLASLSPCFRVKNHSNCWKTCLTTESSRGLIYSLFPSFLSLLLLMI